MKELNANGDGKSLAFNGWVGISTSIDYSSKKSSGDGDSTPNFYVFPNGEFIGVFKWG